MTDQNNDLVKEAVNFFKKEPGFQRLFHAFIKKYQSLGRVGGSIRLEKLSDIEKEAVSRLLRRDLSNQKSVTVKLADFERELENTRFAGTCLKELLDGFAGYEILSKAEVQNRYREQKEQFFHRLAGRYTHSRCQQWLEHVREKGSGTRGIHQAYDEDAGLLEQQLENVLQALTSLPGPGIAKTPAGFQRLPVFAHKVTGDPHGFDPDRAQGRFLISALQFIRRLQDENYPVHPSPPAEEINELLGHFGIIRDDVLNFVTCAGILAYGASGSPLGMWQSACREGAVLNVPLRELIKTDTLAPATSSGKEKAIFLVENSGVFSEIVDRFAGSPLPPVVCTHGQARLAALLLLDRLVAGGSILYYSGDFDPEGLQMAQRMTRRYGEALKLWRYDAGDYKNSISEVTIPPERLKKLQSVDTPGLQPVKEMLTSTGRAGYQEHLVHKLVADIKEKIHKD